MYILYMNVQCVLIEEYLLAEITGVSDFVGVHQMFGVAVLLLQLFAAVFTLELWIRLCGKAGHVFFQLLCESFTANLQEQMESDNFQLG